jgi:hypothetical protein
MQRASAPGNRSKTPSQAFARTERKSGSALPGIGCPYVFPHLPGRRRRCSLSMKIGRLPGHRMALWCFSYEYIHDTSRFPGCQNNPDTSRRLSSYSQIRVWQKQMAPVKQAKTSKRRSFRPTERLSCSATSSKGFTHIVKATPVSHEHPLTEAIAFRYNPLIVS